MRDRLKEVLSGKEENYILPFFWQHGESAEKLREYMKVICDSGIRAVCVESRPHPDFVGPKWWEDMDVILEEAGKRDMKVWVLDDAHFPTGFCNGKIAEHPEYGKVYLDHYTIDVMGPDPYASFLIQLEESEELVGVVAARRKTSRDVTYCGSEADGSAEAEWEKAQGIGSPGELTKAVDVTEFVAGQTLFWPVPEGYWNVTVIKSTRKGTGRKNYCNLIDRQAVRFFLDTVYEPHFSHYGKLFGKVFAGFFSDEPELGNTFGESEIGRSDMMLPWCGELEELSRKAWGEDRNRMLASLWNHTEGLWERARYEYMNMVTDLYGVNFCGQVGEWCSAHGVEYIGHVIEDNGRHAKTGYGTGHFFKALWGQHMSGIDVVLQQIRPGYDHMDFYHIGGKNTYDGRFFHYGLAKMGSSLASLDEKKQGRTMCEVYGAYGWSEGLKLMKWLTDHMLVRGVNWFVPHAFTPAEFPDSDCPPHFYANGKNPQFPWFGSLMHYMNRMCHLLNGGNHAVKTAVLYTAESSWMGQCTPFEEVNRILMRSQIDFEVVPIGLLQKRVFWEKYSVLVVPPCEKIPQELTEFVETAEKKGFPVIFVGKMPETVESPWRQEQAFSYWRNTDKEEKAEKGGSISCQQGADIFCCEGSSIQLPVLLEKLGVKELFLSEQQPWLRVYHYRQQDGEYYLFFQEHPFEPLETYIALPEEYQDRKLYWYDGFDNELYTVQKEQCERIGGEAIQLSLAPYETLVLCVKEKDAEAAVRKRATPKADAKILSGEWKLAYKSCGERTFSDEETAAELVNITGVNRKPDFSGTVRYEMKFFWNLNTQGTEAVLDCGRVFETLEVWLNGEKEAVRIAPPYRMRLEHLKEGENTLVLYVTNTLVHQQKDGLSKTMPVEASGLLGPVSIG